MQLVINETTISYIIQYSKRKKLALEFSSEGLITVKAPLKTSKEEIERFLNVNSKALISFVKRFNSRTYIQREKTYDEDEYYMYLGKAYPLSTLLGETPDSNEEKKSKLKQFYTTKTRALIKDRINHFEKVIGVKAKSVTIVESATTWGTCNSKKELTFNYKLSMAPIEVIDSVVIHELCHLLHMNHDRSFLRKIGKYDPDYEKHSAYLARFGGVMTI